MTISNLVSRVSVIALSIYFLPQAALAQSTTPSSEAITEPSTPDHATAPTTVAKTSEPDDNAPGDIVVSATRRETRLQSTPVAISALSNTDLKEKGIGNVADIGHLIPNLEVASGRGDSGGGFIFIRGVGQGDDNPSADPGVAQYIDDVYMGRIQGALVNLNDTASVEVLRGPQGTLYGKNTIGGAIRINTVLPGDTPDFSAIMRYGNYNAYTFSIAGSVPITDKLFVRVSAEKQANDGYMQNLFDNTRVNRTDVLSGRLVIRAIPTDNLDLVFTLDGTRDRSGLQEGRLIAFALTPLSKATLQYVGPLQNYVLQPGAAPFTGGSFNSLHDAALGNTAPFRNVWGAAFRATWDLGGAKLKSITSYRALEDLTYQEVDASPLPETEQTNYLKQHQFSQELQLSGTSFGDRLNWMGGLYYLDEKAVFKTNGQNIVGAESAIGDQSFLRNLALETKSEAVFANADYKITDKLTVTVGARFTAEQKSIDILTTTFLPPIKTKLGPVSAKSDFQNFSPKAGLSYQFTPDIFGYVSAARGFKSGGFNGRAGQNAALQAYLPETVTSYEGGLKTQFFDRKLTLNAAVFYADYKNIQLTAYQAINGQIINTVVNAGRAHLDGIEVESSLRPTKALTLFANFSLLEAKYDQYIDAIAGDVSYRHFQHAPKFIASGGFDYRRPLSDTVTFNLNMDYSWRSTTYNDVPNSPSIVQPGYGLLNGRVSLRFDDDKYELAVYGKNLTNKYYLQNGIDVLGSYGYATGYFGDPRTYGVELRVHF